MERLCPGLLYMFTSRGTTIGTPEDRSLSAIFFTTDELTRDRIQNLTKNQNGELCKKKKVRSQWVKLVFSRFFCGMMIFFWLNSFFRRKSKSGVSVIVFEAFPVFC